MTSAAARINSIYRYPVKGLSPQPLARTRLVPGATLPADRLYAIENGPSGFDPAAPAYFPKIRFLMLMRNERLAALRTDYDEASHTLTIHSEGREAARGDLRTRGRPPRDRGLLPPLHAEGTARTAEGAARPRATASPTWPGRSCRSSTSPRSRRWRPRWARRSIRCASAAMSMSPAGRPGTNSICSTREIAHRRRAAQGGQAHRALRRHRRRSRHRHPRPRRFRTTLMQSFGHADCGVYAEVIAGGEIAVGDDDQRGLT